MRKSVAPEQIARAILVLRGHRALLDAELAALYGVTTKRLNEQVKRNATRFPADFIFRLTPTETVALNRSQKLRPVPRSIARTRRTWRRPGSTKSSPATTKPSPPSSLLSASSCTRPSRSAGLSASPRISREGVATLRRGRDFLTTAANFASCLTPTRRVVAPIMCTRYDRQLPSNQFANFPKNEHWRRRTAEESIVSSIDKWRGFSSANWRDYATRY
jgi:hypothetical protein